MLARMADQRKQSLYFPAEMLEEIKAEAARLDRSVSWLVQRAWKRARAQVRGMPGANDPTRASDAAPDALPQDSTECSEEPSPEKE